MKKENETVSPPSSDEWAVDTGPSLQATICLVVSLALIGVGFVTLTNLYMLFTPLVELLTKNPFVTISGLVGVIVFATICWLSCKYSVVQHVSVHAGLLALVTTATYFLSIHAWSGGEPHVTIWAPILMQIGVLTLATCLTRHAGEPGDIRDFSVIFGVLQVFLVFVLGITLLITDTEAKRKRFNDAREHFASLHVGESTSMPEIIEFQGERFECAMVGGAGKCTYASRVK